MNIANLAHIDQFTGTAGYYPTINPHFLITDGTKFLAENADAFWLLDEIALAQMLPIIKKDDRLQEMQFWTLKATGSNSGKLICERDTDDVAYTKDIEFTDFPFTALEPRIWVAPTEARNGRVMVGYLPSEH